MKTASIQTVTERNIQQHNARKSKTCKSKALEVPLSTENISTNSFHSIPDYPKVFHFVAVSKTILMQRGEKLLEPIPITDLRI